MIRQYQVVDYLGTISNQKLRKTLTVWTLRLVDTDKLGNHEKTDSSVSSANSKRQSNTSCYTAICIKIFKRFFAKIKLKYKEYNTLLDRHKI